MKILVVDDTKSEREAAATQLAGHEFTIVNSFKVARKILELPQTFDIVMTDLMMPGESEGLGPVGDPYIGEPVPYGLVLALLAKKVGVPMVAIVSNGNHHNHPVFWACDALSADHDWIIPGLWAFTGYACPMKSVGASTSVKAWGAVLERITKE